jgi:glycerol uptake facilitator protein
VAETDTTEAEVLEEEQAPLGRRLLAEFVGTLVFVAVGTGAATVLLLGPTKALGGISEQLGGDPGQEAVFGALLGNNFGDVLALALAFALVLSTLVYAFGGVSGAHFNPAVTFSLAVSRRFKWKEVPFYWIIQCIGAIAGTAIVAGLFKSHDPGVVPGGEDVLFGATTLATDVTQWQGLLAEAFITFILVTAIMAIAVDPRAPKGWSGLVIGLSLGAGILVTASVSGGSANFARTLGPFVVSMLFDAAPDIPWKDLLVYAGGPLIGGAAAALVYESVTGLEVVSPAPHPGAATPTTVDNLVEDVHTHAADEGHPHSHGGDIHSHPHDHEDGPGHEHPH